MVAFLNVNRQVSEPSIWQDQVVGDGGGAEGAGEEAGAAEEGEMPVTVKTGHRVIEPAKAVSACTRKRLGKIQPFAIVLQDGAFGAV